MEDTEENTEDVRRVTRLKMVDMEEKAAEISHEVRRSNRCMKAEIKKMKAEAYHCLARER